MGMKKPKDSMHSKASYGLFFLIGIALFVVGIGTGHFSFLVMGIVFIILGIAYNDEHAKKQPQPIKSPTTARRKPKKKAKASKKPGARTKKS
jgi:flagellar biosynthesis component FlhA